MARKIVSTGVSKDTEGNIYYPNETLGKLVEVIEDEKVKQRDGMAPERRIVRIIRFERKDGSIGRIDARWPVAYK